MTAEKLYKTETLKWNAPILSFGIERPCSMVIGSSTRAEKQFWPLNLDTLTKTSSSVGHQQILPRQQPVKVAPIAKRDTELMVHFKEDHALKYTTSKWDQITEVKIITGPVPEFAVANATGTRIAKPTVNQRHTGFRNELVAILSSIFRSR